MLRLLPVLLVCGLLAPTGPLVRAAEPRLVCEFDTDDFEKPKGITPPYEYLAVADDGTRLATAGPNNTVVLWDCAPHALQQYLTPAHAAAQVGNTRPMALAFSPDGKQLAAMRGWTFGENKDPPKGALWLRTWSTERPGRGRQLESPHTPLGNLQQAWYSPVLAYSPDGKRLAAGYSTVEYSWDWLKNSRARFPQLPKESFSDADGASRTVVGVFEGRKMGAAIASPDWGFARFAFTPGGAGLALWDGNTRSVVIHDLNGKAPPRRVADLSTKNWFGALSALAISDDGKTLTALCVVNLRAEKKGSFHVDGSRIRLARFDLSAGDEATYHQTPPNTNTNTIESADIDVFRGALELAADGGTFLAQSDKGSLKVYDCATAEAIATLSLGDDHKIGAAALSRSGRFVVVSSKWGFIRVWELKRPGKSIGEK